MLKCFRRAEAVARVRVRVRAVVRIWEGLAADMWRGVFSWAREWGESLCGLISGCEESVGYRI
jgi:hypothetical protein